MCGRQDEIIAAAVILCAYAEQGDKLEIVEKLVSAAKQNFRPDSLARDSEKHCKNYLLDYNSNKESLSLNVYFSFFYRKLSDFHLQIFTEKEAKDHLYKSHLPSVEMGMPVASDNSF